MNIYVAGIFLIRANLHFSVSVYRGLSGDKWQSFVDGKLDFLFVFTEYVTKALFMLMKLIEHRAKTLSTCMLCQMMMSAMTWGWIKCCGKKNTFIIETIALGRISRMSSHVATLMWSFVVKLWFGSFLRLPKDYTFP